MKKRIIGLILALTLLFLGGCTGNVQQEPTVPNTTGTTEPVDYWQNVKDRAVDLPVYESDEPLLEYDPDREILITWVNQSKDFYTNPYGNATSFSILSREALTEEDIEIQIPCQTEYSILKITDFSRSFASDANWSKHGFNDFVSLCYNGTDFRELWQYGAWITAALELERESFEAKKQEDGKNYQQITQECVVKQNQIISQWNSVPRADIPKEPVYGYTVSVQFSDTVSYDETVETADVLIKGERHTLDIGQWRFHAQVPEDLASAMKTLGENNQVRVASRQGLCNDGYLYCGSAFQFTAEEDMTILGLRQVFGGDTPLKVLGARVYVTGSQVIDYFWDMEQPLDIRKGDEVKIDLYFKDPLFEEYLYFISVTYLLECQDRQNNYSFATRINSAGESSVLELWLVGFEGIDVRNYYYYLHHVDTFDNLPESWLE